MSWEALADWFEMGGYALYVWGSYLMAGVGLAWEAAMVVQRRRRAIEELREDIGH